MFRKLWLVLYAMMIIFITLLFPSQTKADENEVYWDSKMPTNEDTPPLMITILIITFTISTLLSLGSCVTLWLMFFYLYGNIYRIMWSLEEKLRIATKRLSNRKFCDDIMAQMRLMAPYDNTRNDQEISTMLKSVYHSQPKAAAR